MPFDATALAASLGDGAPEAASFAHLVERLSDAAVRRRWEAYRDIAWDAPENEIDASDPRWEADASWDPLARSDWYRDQPPERRSLIGLHRHVGALAVAIDFEAVLARGLLSLARHLPDHHPAFRFIYHEISEEAQHSMMFREVIDRSGLDPPRLHDHAHMQFDRVAELACDDPVLFFVAALSGEEVFDHLQRRALASSSTHPLIATVSRIHVIEEARHVSFARALLRQVVPRLGTGEIRHLRYQVPFVVKWTAGYLLGPSVVVPSAWDVPADVVASLLRGPSARAARRESLSGVVRLCDELGLVDRRLAAAWSTLTGA